MLPGRTHVHHGVGWVVRSRLVGIGDRAAAPLAPAPPGATRPVVAVLAVAGLIIVTGRPVVGRLGVGLGRLPPAPAGLRGIGDLTIGPVRGVFAAGRVAIGTGP